jgi:hypothetical protein
MPKEMQLIATRDIEPARRSTAKSISLFSLCLLSIVGCVYPASTTYYEAVDQPRSEANKGEEHIVSCPSTNYSQRRLGENLVWVIPQYHESGNQVRVNVTVLQANSVTFQGWNVGFTSLADAHIRTSVPLRFYTSCPKANAESCPKIAAEPNAQNGSGFFVGVADIPPEFAAGFILELQAADKAPILDLKPQKFELRTNVLLRGTFGCG